VLVSGIHRLGRVSLELYISYQLFSAIERLHPPTTDSSSFLCSVPVLILILTQSSINLTLSATCSNLSYFLLVEACLISQQQKPERPACSLRLFRDCENPPDRVELHLLNRLESSSPFFFRYCPIPKPWTPRITVRIKSATAPDPSMSTAATWGSTSRLVSRRIALFPLTLLLLY
jgi:hypothetical protein